MRRYTSGRCIQFLLAHQREATASHCDIVDMSLATCANMYMLSDEDLSVLAALLADKKKTTCIYFSLLLLK